jgi:hypothetical protein
MPTRFYLITMSALLVAAIANAGDVPAPKKADGAELDTLVKDLGSEDFATREKASKGLIDAGASAKGTLEKLAKDSPDAEVRERAASIVRAINMPKDFAALSADEREIAKLAFETKVSDAGKTVNFKNYAHGGAFISDFGNIRVCIADTPYNGMSSGSITVGAGGGSASVKAGSFSAQSANGSTAISFRALKWSVEKDVMKIAGQELEFGGYARKIVFLDKAGKFLKRCDIPEDANPDKK